VEGWQLQLADCLGAKKLCCSMQYYAHDVKVRRSRDKTYVWKEYNVTTGMRNGPRNWKWKQPEARTDDSAHLTGQSVPCSNNALLRCRMYCMIMLLLLLLLLSNFQFPYNWPSPQCCVMALHVTESLICL